MSRLPSICTFSVLVLLTAIIEAGDQPAPKFVRLAIIDTSGSMDGSRLEVARDELLRVASQLAPSPSYPFIVIPFDSDVRDTQTFTDIATMQTFLSGLSAGGGTNIASGLARAVDELNRCADAQNVCVFLYTDGEDSSETEIADQEARLDALFADRQTKGLQQTVVFCKRWQRANAHLVKQLMQRNHARVVDAGQLNLVPLTLEPEIVVQDVQWIDDAPSTLEILLAAAIHTHGNKSGHTPAPLLLECTTPQAEGDLRTLVPPGAVHPTPLTIRLPVAPDNVVSGDPLELEFELAEPQVAASDDGLVLPLLALDRITVPVNPPQTGFHSLIGVSVEQPSGGKWLDPLRLRAAVPLKLALEVTSADGKPWSQPVPFRIVPESGSALVEGDDALLLGGPGRYEVTVTMSGVPQYPDSGASPPEFLVAFRIVPQNLPPNATFEPPELGVEQHFPSPSQVTTMISARFLSLAPPQWIDVVKGIASFQADVVVSVAGPLSPNAELVLRCPPAIHDVKINPNVLQSGEQTVRLTLWARLTPAPTREQLVFRILPPPAYGAVHYDAPHPLSCHITGPRPLQLALSDGKRVPSHLTTTLRDTSKATRLRIVPVVLHLNDALAVRGLSCSLQTQGRVSVASPGHLPVHVACDLSVRVNQRTSTSFFRDVTVDDVITVSPPSGVAAVIGSRQPVRVRIEAPFKRLVFYLAVGISLVIALLLMLRMYLRLRTTIEG